MTRRLLRAVSYCLLFVLAASLLAPLPAGAAPASNRGLFITPIRQYVTLVAGTTKRSNFTVANYTDKPMTVSFSVKQFSVSDYSYDYSFDDTAGSQLVSLTAADALLKPGENKVVPYSITIPLGSTPGGRYYTILATAASRSGSLQEKVQAASLIYITIDGTLDRSNNIGAVSMRRFVFGSQIPFSMDVSNTGNTHYFMYLSANLQGLLTSKSQVSETHLLLPIKTRHLESSLPSPVLPGIYKATYGYRTEYTAAVTRTARVIYIPPWSIATFLVLIWLGWQIKRKIHHRHARTQTKEE